MIDVVINSSHSDVASSLGATGEQNVPVPDEIELSIGVTLETSGTSLFKQLMKLANSIWRFATLTDCQYQCEMTVSARLLDRSLDLD